MATECALRTIHQLRKSHFARRQDAQTSSGRPSLLVNDTAETITALDRRPRPKVSGNSPSPGWRRRSPMPSITQSAAGSPSCRSLLRRCSDTSSRMARRRVIAGHQPVVTLTSAEPGAARQCPGLSADSNRFGRSQRGGRSPPLSSPVRGFRPQSWRRFGDAKSACHGRSPWTHSHAETVRRRVSLECDATLPMKPNDLQCRDRNEGVSPTGHKSSCRVHKSDHAARTYS